MSAASQSAWLIPLENSSPSGAVPHIEMMEL
jgi:hypothetical protein